jgi:hypothetical protein
VRRALLSLWPALSRVYGLHPWDVDLLTLAELHAYDDDLAGLLEARRHPAEEA